MGWRKEDGGGGDGFDLDPTSPEKSIVWGRGREGREGCLRMEWKQT